MDMGSNINGIYQVICKAESQVAVSTQTRKIKGRAMNVFGTMGEM